MQKRVKGARARGTFSQRRRPNMPIVSTEKNPYVTPRAPISFTSGLLATPVDAVPGSADEICKVAAKFPALAEALNFPKPSSDQIAKAGVYWMTFAAVIASEFVPGFRNSMSPIPAVAAKKGKSGKTANDEKTALMFFDMVRPHVKTDCEAWARYAAAFLDPSLRNPSKQIERDSIARNLEIRMSPLVAARRQKAKAGRPQ